MKKLILSFVFLISTTAHAQEAVSEDALKAAYIFHFIDFTEWQDNQPQYDVCIPDDSQLRAVAKQTLEGKTANGRTINVVSRRDNCHILVAQQAPPMPSVLTIGPLANGSLLEFRLVDNKLKFAVNMEKLKKSRLKISSQLLKLAILENG